MFSRAFGVTVVATVIAALSLQSVAAGDKKKFEISKDAIAGTVKSVDEKAAKFTITVKGNGFGVRGWAFVADRDWFHPPARRYFRLFTPRRSRCSCPTSPPRRTMGGPSFVAYKTCWPWVGSAPLTWDSHAGQ